MRAAVRTVHVSEDPVPGLAVPRAEGDRRHLVEGRVQHLEEPVLSRSRARTRLGERGREHCGAAGGPGVGLQGKGSRGGAAGEGC